MKKLAYETEGIENAFVEFDEKTLAPTYRLITGMAGNSNAFNICHRFGLPAPILERAEMLKQASPLHDMDTLMAELNRNLAEAQQERERLAEKVKEAEALHRELTEADRFIQEKKHAIFEKAREEAEDMKRDLRIQAETIIKQLKKQAADLDKQKLTAQVDTARKAIEDISVPKKGSDRVPMELSAIRVGDFVFVDNLDSVGRVEAVSGKKITVDCGGMTVTTSAAHCFMPTKQELPKKKSPQSVARKSSHAAPTVRDIHDSLNIIGCTVDEAIPQIDSFLNDALLSGLSAVRIVHGKGTGALRRGVQDYLATQSYVKEFHTADERSGGAGATDVYL